MLIALLACVGLLQDPTKGTVVGRIEDANGDQAAGEWRVVLTGANGPPLRAEWKHGEFRFEDVDPGSVQVGAQRKDFPGVALLRSAGVEVEAGKEVFVVLEDQSRWVLVEVDDHRARFEGFDQARVVLTDSEGHEETWPYHQGSEATLFTDPGTPPFQLRLEGDGIRTVGLEGIRLLERVTLDVHGTGSLSFEAQDVATRRLLTGARINVAWPHAYYEPPVWQPLGDDPLEFSPGSYSIRLELISGQELRFERIEVEGGETTTVPLAIGEVAPLRLHLPSADERTTVSIDEVTVPGHLGLSGGVFERDHRALVGKGRDLELGAFPIGTTISGTVHWGPWFAEQFSATIDGARITLEPGPRAFVEAGFVHAGDPPDDLFPIVRSRVPGHTRTLTAQWDDLREREPVRPGLVSVGLRAGAGHSWLPEIELEAGAIVSIHVLVEDWIPTRCPLLVTVDGESVRGGFSVGPGNTYVLSGQRVYAGAPQPVDLVLVDDDGTWVHREPIDLEPGDERQLRFTVARTARRVRFLDPDGDPAARRRIRVIRAHPLHPGLELSSNVRTDEDGWAEVRLSPGPITFARLGREVSVDWPVEVETLTFEKR